MKRFQLLVLASMIAAGAIWMGFYRSRHTSSAAVATLLPKETLAFVHLPDFNRSRAELHQTDLYQIWTEPAVQDFLAKPRTKIPSHDGLGPILQECETLQIKDAFFALIDIEHSAWKIVGGFRFAGDRANAEKITAGWRAKVLGRAPDLNRETLEYQGHQIQSDTAGIVRLSTVLDGQWFFLANDPEQLKPLLDRVDGRSDHNSVLAGDDVFAAASKRMPSTYTALTFARIDRLVEKLMPLAERDAHESADQMAAIRQIRSFCAATAFDGGKIRDTIFVGMPKLLDAGDLTRASLSIATKDTFLYAAGFLNLTQPVPLPTSPGALGWMSGLHRITDALSSNGITLESWNSAFGPEFSWVGDWPANSHLPSVYAALPVKDSAKAKKILEVITTADEDSAAWTQQEKDGELYFSTRLGGQFFSLSPTIGLSNRMMVVGADADSVEVALKHNAKGDSELAASKNFQNTERAVPAAKQAFTYLDPALLYTRIDATVRPMLFMSAVVLPGIADTVDLNKLPPPEVITRHLSPIVMSQNYDKDGYIAESVGPLTFYQAIVGLGGVGGAAAAFYHRQNQPPISQSVAPASVPSASPAPSPE